MEYIYTLSTTLTKPKSMFKSQEEFRVKGAYSQLRSIRLNKILYEFFRANVLPLCNIGGYKIIVEEIIGSHSDIENRV